MEKSERMNVAWYYLFTKGGKAVIVISRMPVCDFEILHNVWVEDLWEVV